MQAYTLQEFKMSNFDTLKFSKRAVGVGFTEQQAEFQAEEMSKIIDDYIATKEDIKLVRLDIELIRLEIKSAENRIIIKMGSMMVVAISIIATIFKIF